MPLTRVSLRRGKEPAYRRHILESLYLAMRETRNIVERLAKSPGVRPQDISINLVEVLPENWSFGHGVAQYVR